MGFCVIGLLLDPHDADCIVFAVDIVFAVEGASGFFAQT